MPVAIYNALQAGDEKTANILVLIMTVIAVTTLFFIGQLSRKKRRGFNA